MHFCFHLIHLHNGNVDVHSVFPKPIDTIPSVFLDGILGIWSALFGTRNFKQATGTRSNFYYFKLRWLARVGLDMFWFSTGQETTFLSISNIFWVADMFLVIIKEGRQFPALFSGTNVVKLWERRLSHFRNGKHLFRKDLYLFEFFSVSQEYSLPRPEPYL